jgi:hypothetical protein
LFASDGSGISRRPPAETRSRRRGGVTAALALALALELALVLALALALASGRTRLGTGFMILYIAHKYFWDKFFISQMWWTKFHTKTIDKNVVSYK